MYSLLSEELAGRLYTKNYSEWRSVQLVSGHKWHSPGLSFNTFISELD